MNRDIEIPNSSRDLNWLFSLSASLCLPPELRVQPLSCGAGGQPLLFKAWYDGSNRREALYLLMPGLPWRMVGAIARSNTDTAPTHPAMPLQSWSGSPHTLTSVECPPCPESTGEEARLGCCYMCMFCISDAGCVFFFPWCFMSWVVTCMLRARV